MSAIALLMGLLVLSYLGSLLVGSEKTPGLASGIEYVGLGFLVGPHALAFVDRAMIVEFEPIVQVALGWLTFVVGVNFGQVDTRDVDRSATMIGIAGAVVTGALVTIAVHTMLASVDVPGVDAGSALVLSAGAGAVCAETARHGVEWVRGRWGANGPVSRLLVDIGASDDLAPLVAVGAIFAVAHPGGGEHELAAWGWFGASMALGALLGVVTALLLRGAEGDAVWGALIGTLLLGVGGAGRFHLSTLFVTFVMGIALAAASPRRRQLRKLVTPTERAVLYPMLLLAGARLDLRPVFENQLLVALVALVLLARIAGKVASGLLVRAKAPVVRPAGGWLGIVMLSSGPVSIACAFVFALRFPGPVGDTLLVCAVAAAVLGEVVSTFALKAMLSEAGEILPAVRPAAPSRPPPPVPVAATSSVDLSSFAPPADEDAP